MFDSPNDKKIQEGFKRRIKTSLVTLVIIGVLMSAGCSSPQEYDTKQSLPQDSKELENIDNNKDEELSENSQRGILHYISIYDLLYCF